MIPPKAAPERAKTLKVARFYKLNPAGLLKLAETQSERIKALESELARISNRNAETVRLIDRRIGQLKRLEARLEAENDFDTRYYVLQRIKMELGAELESIKTNLEATPRQRQGTSQHHE